MLLPASTRTTSERSIEDPGRRGCRGRARYPFAAIAALMLLAAAAAEARPVTAAWDANLDGVTTGYRLYHGPSSGVYDVEINVGDVTTYQLDLLPGVTRFFMVRAYNQQGELGPPSNEDSITLENLSPQLVNPGNRLQQPGTVSITLVATDPDADPLTFSATGLPGTVSVNGATGVISGTLAAGLYTVTARASDGHLQSQQIFTVRVDNAPVLVNPGNRTITSGAFSIQLEASDADGDAIAYAIGGFPPTVSVNGTSGVISGTIGVGSYAVTAGASDGYFQSVKAFIVQVFQANRAPILVNPGTITTVPGPVAFQLSASDPDGNPLTYSIGGLPATVVVNAATGAVGGSIGLGSYSATASASDGSLTATQSFAVHVTQSNRPPTLANPGNLTITAGAIALQLSASDPDGDPLTYALFGLPPSVVVNAGSGAVSGTIGPGTYFATAQVSDGSLQATQPFTVQVQPVVNPNRPPVLANPGDQSIPPGLVSLQLSASDPDGDTLTYGLTGVPATIILNAATGAISGSIGPGSYFATASVSDGTLSAQQSFTVHVIDTPNRPPALSNPGDISMTAGPISLQLSAVDPDGDTLTYSLSGLPPTVIVAPATGAVSGSIDAGTYFATAAASDGSLQATQAFRVIVQGPVTNRAPVLANPGDMTIPPGPVAFQLSATDPDGDPVTYSVTGLPPTVIVNAATGAASGSIGLGSHVATATASDGALASQQSFTIHVATANRPPALTNPGNQTIPAGPLSLQLSAVDPDGDALTYSLFGLPPTVAINAATGAVSGTVAPGTYFATAVASDGKLQASQTFTVQATTPNGPPVLSSPGNLSVAAGPFVLQLVAIDPDGDPLTYFVAGLPSTVQLNTTTGLVSGFLLAGSYVVTASVSDGSLLAAQTFTITVTGSYCPGPIGAPTLQFTTDRNTVVLSWALPPTVAPPVTHIIRAGSGPGLSNIAVIDTGSPATTFTATAPDGLYFVRVIARNGCGDSPPSNEVAIRVSSVVAGPPSGLAAMVSALRRVTLTWVAPSGGVAPTSYLVEAGSAPGLTDLASFGTGSAATALYDIPAPPGTYYVRVRAQTSGGAGPPSNEIIVVVR